MQFHSNIDILHEDNKLMESTFQIENSLSEINF
jgi:hypothetical protein